MDSYTSNKYKSTCSPPVSKPFTLTLHKVSTLQIFDKNIETQAVRRDPQKSRKNQDRGSVPLGIQKC